MIIQIQSCNYKFTAFNSLVVGLDCQNPDARALRRQMLQTRLEVLYQVLDIAMEVKIIAPFTLEFFDFAKTVSVDTIKEICV